MLSSGWLLDNMVTKDIIRFFRDGRKKRLIFTGITEEQAREWCSIGYTHKKDKEGNVIWFDGFDNTGLHFGKKDKPKYASFFIPIEQE